MVSRSLNETPRREIFRRDAKCGPGLDVWRHWLGLTAGWHAELVRICSGCPTDGKVPQTCFELHHERALTKQAQSRSEQV